MPLHHLHLHLSLYMYLDLHLYPHLYLYPRQNPNLHIRLGVLVTLQDIQCCWKLPHLIHEITAVDMGMHGQVVSCHPLVWIDSEPTMSGHGIWHATQATTDICLTQWLRSSSRLYGGGGKEAAEGGRGSLSVRRRQQPGLQIATIRDTNEGNASDTMHACSRIVGCQCRQGAMSIPVVLLTGLQGSVSAHLSNVRGRFRQSSWSEDDLLISGRLKSFTKSRLSTRLVDSLRGRMLPETEVPAPVQCAMSLFENQGHPPKK